MRITSENGHQRPTLSEQINRLDAILDGLADNLNEAVARAVREAVGSAVKEALQGVLTEVLNHPEPLNKLRPEPDVKASAAPPPATSVAEQGWLGRLAGVAQAAAGTVVHLTRRASARVAQLAPGWWKTIAAHLASGWRRLQMLWQGVRTYLSGLVRVAWQIRRPLLIALGVGSVLGLGCSVAGPVVAVTVSGLAGVAGALVVSAANALRRALASIKAQNA